MGYIVIKTKENKKITITNDFNYIFLISDGPKKLPVERLFHILEQHGEKVTTEEIKKLTFKFRN
ncbi:MAG: hypothetical protein HPY60_11585 [Candidatus Methanofastidiosum sp.]|nr:hypothetical protein [Methanofastidiosum sp.]